MINMLDPILDMLTQWLPYILSGGAVGVLVGLTGVGGGSLMTPILIAFGYNPAVAIGTDLFYAAITKSGGIFFHQKSKHIHWNIVGAMAAGSLPAAIITAFSLKTLFSDTSNFTQLLTTSLGIMLILTAMVLIFRKYIVRSINMPFFSTPKIKRAPRLLSRKHALIWTFILGIPLGSLVTLSSVGAGALGTALLLALYPKLSGTHVVGTDIAHAVPLTFIAGLSHFIILDTLDFKLLIGLLIGSLPGIALGAKLSTKVPNDILTPLLAACLLGLGIKYAFFY